MRRAQPVLFNGHHGILLWVPPDISGRENTEMTKISELPVVLEAVKKAAAAPAIPAGADPAVMADITSARGAHARSKTGAAEAAALAYLVWRKVEAPYAHAEDKKWFAEAVEKRNGEIKTFNTGVNKLQSRATKFKDKALDADDLANQTSTDPVKAAEIKAEQDKLREHAKLKPKEWSKLRKVRIAARAGASDFTMLVKFVFGFEHVSDASMTSRYCTALAWLNSKFGGLSVNGKESLVEAIQAAGGIDMVVAEQRGNVEGKEQAETDRKAISDAVVKRAKEAFDHAPALGSITMDVKNAEKDVVLLLCRHKGGTVEVVAQMPVAKDKVDKELEKFDDPVLLPTKNEPEFVSRVLALGGLIPEGKAPEVYVDGEFTGHADVEARTLFAVPNAKADIELMMSSLCADVSVVVKARPNPEVVELGQLSVPAAMDWKSRRALEKSIKSRAQRRLISIAAIEDDGGEMALSWSVENEALCGVKSPNAVKLHAWRDMSEDTKMPLDIDGFKARFTLTVKATDLGVFYEAAMRKWETSANGKKNETPMVLTFKAGAIVYSFGKEPEVTLPCTGKVASPVTLKFSARALCDLFEKLVAQHGDTYSFSADEGGMLAISWTDKLGSYEVYQYAQSEKGAALSKRLKKFYFEAEEQNEAQAA